MAHYAKAGDPLRLRAARFLIGNMRLHHYYDSPLLTRYYARASEIGRERDRRKRLAMFRELYAELGDIGAGKQPTADSAALTADALIANIDSAYADWQHGCYARPHLPAVLLCRRARTDIRHRQSKGRPPHLQRCSLRRTLHPPRPHRRH